MAAKLQPGPVLVPRREADEKVIVVQSPDGHRLLVEARPAPADEEVVGQHDGEPHAEDHPGDRRQPGQHVDAGGDGEDRGHRVAGHLERALQVGWCAAAR